MLRIRPSKGALLVLALVAVAIMVGCGFMYFNCSARLQAAETEVKKQQELLANSKRTARRLETVEQEYTDDQMKLSVLEKGVSTNAYVPTLLRQLEDMGRHANLRVVGVKPKKPDAPVVVPSSGTKVKEPVKKPEPYDKLLVEIDVVGKYWDVVRFLGLVTSFPKIIAVNDVQVSPVTEMKHTGSPELFVKLNTTAFILKSSTESNVGTSRVPVAERT